MLEERYNMFLVAWAFSYSLYLLLQAVLEERERHAAALYDYQAKVEDNEAWLTAAKAGHGAAPLLSQDVASLDQQLQETQVRNHDWQLTV